MREQIGDVATIVSVDMDVLEPGECPGVGFLETGENKKQLMATFCLFCKRDSSYFRWNDKQRALQVSQSFERS